MGRPLRPPRNLSAEQSRNIAQYSCAKPAATPLPATRRQSSANQLIAMPSKDLAQPGHGAPAPRRRRRANPTLAPGRSVGRQRDRSRSGQESKWDRAKRGRMPLCRAHPGATKGRGFAPPRSRRRRLPLPKTAQPAPRIAKLCGAEVRRRPGRSAAMLGMEEREGPGRQVSRWLPPGAKPKADTESASPADGRRS